MRRLARNASGPVRLFSEDWRTACRPRPLAAARSARATDPLRVRRALACTSTLLAILLGADAALAQTTGPTSDPLRGERRLLPLDDVMFSYFPDNDAVDSALLAGLSCSVGAPPGEGAICGYTEPQSLGVTSNAALGVVAGRMFARPKDTFVVAGDELTLILSGGQSNDSFETWTVPLPHVLQTPQPGTAVYRPLMAMADFNGDGYDELVIGAQDLGLQVARPVDLTDPSKGLAWGDFLSPVETVVGSALAAGDLDGDGLPEVALAYPAGGSGSSSFTLEIYHVDPTQLWLQFEHSVTVDTETAYGQGGFGVSQVSIAAGDFDHDVSALGLPDKEIVVAASGVVAGESLFAIQPFQVFSTLQPVAVGGQALPAFPDCSVCYQYVSVVVDSARTRLDRRAEQVVLGVNGLDADFVERSEFWILTFDGSDQLAPEVQTTELLEVHEHGDCQSGMRGLAIGNFNRPDEQGAAVPFPSGLGIAVLQGFNLGSEVGGPVCTSGPNVVVEPYAIDRRTGRLTGPCRGRRRSSSRPPASSRRTAWRPGTSKAAHCWSGRPRSCRSMTSLSSRWCSRRRQCISTSSSRSTESSPDLLNLSFGLPGFNTKFTESEGTTTTTSHQSTTSHSFAEKESLEQSISFGVPDVASVSAELKTSSEQTQQNVVSQSSSTITTTVDLITAASDLDDRLWYTQQDVDLYLYPVLCPPDPGNAETCGTSPSHVMFSIPQSQTLYSFVPAASVEWYQPPIRSPRRCPIRGPSRRSTTCLPQRPSIPSSRSTTCRRPAP